MRLSSRAVLAVVGAALGMAVARAQAPPALDRTDPAAVAQAYLKACQEGDEAAALALLVPGGGADQVRAVVSELRRYTRTYPMPRLFLEFQFLPLGLPGRRELVGAKTEGDLARVTFRGAYDFEQELLLVRGEDGTWAVKAIDSIQAATRSPRCFAVDGFLVWGGDQPPRPGLAADTSATNLQKLWRGMPEYAHEHGEALPPAGRWVDEIELYVLDRSLFRSPGAPEQECGYAMTAAAGGWAIEDWHRGHQIAVLVEWPGAKP